MFTRVCLGFVWLSQPVVVCTTCIVITELGSQCPATRGPDRFGALAAHLRVRRLEALVPDRRGRRRPGRRRRVHLDDARVRTARRGEQAPRPFEAQLGSDRSVEQYVELLGFFTEVKYLQAVHNRTNDPIGILYTFERSEAIPILPVRQLGPRCRRRARQSERAGCPRK